MKNHVPGVGGLTGLQADEGHWLAGVCAPLSCRRVPAGRLATPFGAASCLLAVLALFPVPDGAAAAAAEGGAEQTGPDASCAVHGTVRSVGGEPLAAAAVTLTASAETVLTGDHGRFCLRGDVGAGDHRLVVFADGHGVGERVFRADGDAAARVDVRLRPAFGEEVVVSATRTDKRLADVPLHMQSVPRSMIEGMAARTLAEAVEWTRGVRVESNCQNCNTTQIRLLGLEGPYSQILVDGQPTLSSLAMVYGVEQVPARLIDSIEVVRGGGSPVYGAGAVAGVINLVPRHPDHTHVEAGGRSGRMSGADGSVSSPSWSLVADWTPGEKRAATVYGQLDRVAPLDVDGDGFSEVVVRDLDATGARYQEFFRDGSARLAADVSYTTEYRRGGDRWWLPGTAAEIAEELDSRRAGASASWLQTASPVWDGRSTVSWASMRRASYYGTGGDANAFGSTRNPLWVFDSQLNRGGASGTFSFGVQASRNHVDDRQPAYGRTVQETWRETSVFLQDDRRVGDGFTLLYGVRADRHSAVEGPIVSPRAALLWSPRSDLTLRASHAAGFRPPASFDEDLHIVLAGGEAHVVRDDPGLREETSTSRMLSLEWRPTIGQSTALAVDASWFDTRLDDLFHNAEADDLLTPEFEFLRVNLGSARVRGVEFGFGVRRGGLTVDAGYVWQRARFGEPEPDFGSVSMYRTPERYGTATVQWPLGDNHDLVAGVRYTGTMLAPHYAGFIAEDRLETTPSFLSWDLGLFRRLALGGDRQVTATIAVRNLTDEYQSDLDQGPMRDPTYVYGPRFPRSVAVGLKVDL